MPKYFKKRSFSKICRQKGISAPEEVIQMQVQHLVSNYDQSPLAVKDIIIERMKKCEQGEFLSSENITTITKDGKHRKFTDWLKHCSGLAGGDQRLEDGCKQFVDTFMSEMVVTSRKNKKNIMKVGFCRRGKDDPPPVPSVHLLNAFASLSLPGLAEGSLPYDTSGKTDDTTVDIKSKESEEIQPECSSFGVDNREYKDWQDNGQRTQESTEENVTYDDQWTQGSNFALLY